MAYLPAIDLRGVAGPLLTLAAMFALGYAAFSRSTGSLLAAVALVHLVLFVTASGPGLGIMLLTTGRFIYFAGLMLTLRLQGDSAYTAGYFLLVDALLVLSLLVHKREKGERRPAPRLLYGAVSIFTVSALVAWVRTDYSVEGLYWLGTYGVFGFLPFLAIVHFEQEQLLSVCRWIFWSVAALAAVYLHAAATGGVSWFHGRASLEILDTPQVGSLFIASVMPIALFSIVFLSKELLAPWKWSPPAFSLPLGWALAGLFAGVGMFTGQRTPVIALSLSASAFLLLTPCLSVKSRLGLAAVVGLLYAFLSFIPNPGRYDVLNRVMLGDVGALSDDETASMRLEYYRICSDTFFAFPLLGSGLGTFYAMSSKASAFPDRIPHNAFLEIAAGQGLFGVIPTAILLISTVWVAVGTLRRAPDSSSLRVRLMSFFLISWLYQLALVGMTSSVFADSAFWCFLGAIWALRVTRHAVPGQPDGASGTLGGRIVASAAGTTVLAT